MGSALSRDCFRTLLNISRHLSCIGSLRVIFLKAVAVPSAATVDRCLQHRHLNFTGITTEQYILLQIQPVPSTVCAAAMTKHTEIINFILSNDLMLRALLTD